MDNTFKDRLVSEKIDLSEKLSKLETFLSSPKLDEIDPHQKSLLFIQRHCMWAYHQVLLKRLELLE